MRKEGKNKLMPVFITLLLLVSMIVILPSSNVLAATAVTLYNNGGGDIPLTCGDELSLKVYDGSLYPDTNYYVAVFNGTWQRLTSSKSADDYGDIELTFRVPGWSDVGVNPLTSNSSGLSTGEWNVSIINASSGNAVSGTNTTLTITNLYDVYYKYGGSTQDSVSFNASTIYPFEIYVRNWTGYNSGWDDPEQDENFYINVTDSGYTNLYSTYHLGSQSKWSWVIDPTDVDYEQSSTSLETYLIFNVTGGNNLNSSARLPILLNLSVDVPSNAEWGDTLSIDGYVKDGQGNAISGYGVHVYAPLPSGAYASVYNVNSYSNGAYAMSIATGTDTTGCAGTWYVGTYKTPNFPRVNNSGVLPIDGFIPYASFEVATKNDVKVTLETTDEIITGFNQTVNVSVYNSSWMESVDMYKNMKIHITGVQSYNYSSGETYSDDDIVRMSTTITKSTSKYAYYVFTWIFNETGTGTIMVSYPENESMVAFSNTISNYYDSYYDDRTGLLPNVTGSTTFAVVGAADMNIVTDDMPTTIEMTQPSGCDDGYKNQTTNITINIYGDVAGAYKNATITILGCGVDVTIKEKDPNANDGSAGQTSKGIYWAKISPKYAGTITITATNSTDNISVSKDYSISGLSGTVTTSIGDDKLVTCGTNEKITATVTNGQYATLRLLYYDINWENCKLLNETIGKNTAGKGLNGIFEFIPDEDDLENVGYIVVGANAGSNLYMYDIVEVEPIHDLTVTVTTPSTGNQTLTVGFDQNVIVEITDANGDLVTEDQPGVIGYVLYDDYTKDTTSYTVEFSNYGTGMYKASLCGGGDGWLPFAGQLFIEVVNNSGQQEHDGSVSLDVDYATVTYSPSGATAGIQQNNLTVVVTVVDANGNPLANENIWFWVENNTDDVASTTEGFEFSSSDNDYQKVNLDSDGAGEFDILRIGDMKTWINCSLQNHNTSDGENTTSGVFNINYPTFIVVPDTIYIGQANMITITANNYAGQPIEGINLTFVSSIYGILTAQPDPGETGANGQISMSLEPQASGKLNVTIARNIRYVGGRLNWTNAVVTDTTVTATSLKILKISVSKSPIFEDETLTVTVTSRGSSVSGVDVEFGETTAQTDISGQATFTVPDPGVESATYSITAEKAGYVSAEKSITVIKIYGITLIGPSTAPGTGQTFTITATAKGSPLAGATISFDGKTYTTVADGSVELTAPSEEGAYTVTANYEDYEDATFVVTITAGGIPGFELLTLIAAIGVAFILLRRRRN